jgi:hypothetical protein
MTIYIDVAIADVINIIFGVLINVNVNVHVVVIIVTVATIVYLATIQIAYIFHVCVAE